MVTMADDNSERRVQTVMEARNQTQDALAWGEGSLGAQDTLNGLMERLTTLNEYLGHRLALDAIDEKYLTHVAHRGAHRGRARIWRTVFAACAVSLVLTALLTVLLTLYS